MTEIFAVYKFVSSRLKGSTPLAALVGTRIYAGIAPSGTLTYPLISFSVRSNRDRSVVDGESAYIDCLLDVKLVTNQGLGSLAAADALVFSLLHRTGAADVDNVHIMGCYRTNSMITEQPDGTEVFRYSIHTYRVRAYRSTVVTLFAGRQ